MKVLNTLALGAILGASISAAESCKVNYVTVTETSTKTVLLSPEEFALRFPPQTESKVPEISSDVVRPSSVNLNPTPSVSSQMLDQTAGFVYATAGLTTASSTIVEGIETPSSTSVAGEPTTTSSTSTSETSTSSTSTSSTSTSEISTSSTSTTSTSSTSTSSTKISTSSTSTSKTSTSKTTSTPTTTKSTSKTSTSKTSTSGTTTTAKSTQTTSSLSNIDKVMLDRTNQKRALHKDTKPLTWSDELAEYAQSYADKFSCSATSISHSGGPYGENLAYGYTPVGAVDAWYAEIKDYDYSHPGFSHATGHFTQLVWASTSQVGCGYKDCSEEGWGLYIACEYYSRGNIINDGYFAANVKPLK